jgi:hypothetical protein
MARGKRTIRASEIGTFLFCQRAWWYQRQKIKSSNQRELTDGSDFHNDHWLRTQAGGKLRSAAWFLLLVGLLALGVYYIINFINH